MISVPTSVVYQDTIKDVDVKLCLMNSPKGIITFLSLEDRFGRNLLTYLGVIL